MKKDKLVEFISKKYIFAIIYTIIIVVFSVFVLIDAFVVDNTAMNLDTTEEGSVSNIVNA